MYTYRYIQSTSPNDNEGTYVPVFIDVMWKGKCFRTE
jgi:hypothetical protein